MHISAISNNNVNSKFNSKLSCKGLIKDPSALPIIQGMLKNDIIEFEQIEQRLSKTKFWDLKISSIGDKFKEFKFHFINKKSNHVITDGIYPYDKTGKSIKFYSIVYGSENTSLNTLETLIFKTKIRADELYDKYMQNVLYARNRAYNITPLESLKMKEVELDMLEEASELPTENHKVATISTDIQLKSSTGNEFFY